MSKKLSAHARMEEYRLKNKQIEKGNKRKAAAAAKCSYKAMSTASSYTGPPLNFSRSKTSQPIQVAYSVFQLRKLPLEIRKMIG